MDYLAKATDMPKEEFEDTKGVIRISKSKKDRQLCDNFFFFVHIYQSFPHL
jgi:hypothetical protein